MAANGGPQLRQSQSPYAVFHVYVSCLRVMFMFTCLHARHVWLHFFPAFSPELNKIMKSRKQLGCF